MKIWSSVNVYSELQNYSVNNQMDTAVSGIPTTHLQVNHYFGCFKITFVADKLKAVVMYGS